MCFDQSSNCSPSKGPSSVYFSGGDDDSTTPLALPGEVRSRSGDNEDNDITISRPVGPAAQLSP